MRCFFLILYLINTPFFYIQWSVGWLVRGPHMGSVVDAKQLWHDDDFSSIHGGSCAAMDVQLAAMVV